MARGPKHHLKRLTAPHHWMLDKLGGVFAPRPTSGPHKLRESLPLILFLRNRLKYALTYTEARKICKQRLIKVDGKVRTEMRFPAGFMDVISIEKTNETFRLLYDTKGRFVCHRITAQEGNYKLCKITKVSVGPKGVPFVNTHDGRTIRYPDPHVKIDDTIVLDVNTSKITDFVKFDAGNLAMITGGRNIGRVGSIVNRERHPGAFDIVHVKDTTGHTFATRVNNVFVIGKGAKPLVSLTAQKGIKLSITEERDKRIAAKKAQMGDKIGKALNGLLCVYKPADLSLNALKKNILKRICTQGETFRTEDLRVEELHQLETASSGVCVFGVNDGVDQLEELRSQQWANQWRIECVLGRETHKHEIKGKVTRKEAFDHVNKQKVKKLLTKVIGDYRRMSFELAEVEMQSSEAFQIASRGIPRPKLPGSQMVVGLKMLLFKLPYLAVSIDSIGETDAWLRCMVNEFGLALDTTASPVRLIRRSIGPFRAEHTVLERQLSLQNIVDNISLTSRLVKEYPYDRDVVIESGKDTSEEGFGRRKEEFDAMRPAWPRDYV
uniref:Small ribosomal subunit protein eS4 n=1 Tax=Pristionchus pacificus TaxID=54126 RepID=A0A2A6B4I6_PRIPA|eukprot:PDM60773.1 rps-4 [Pristionchus pacificus]